MYQKLRLFMFHFKIFENFLKSSLAFELKAKAMDRNLDFSCSTFWRIQWEFCKTLALRGWKTTEKNHFFSKLRVVLVKQKAFDQVYTNWIVIGCKKKIGISILRRGNVLSPIPDCTVAVVMASVSLMATMMSRTVVQRAEKDAVVSYPPGHTNLQMLWQLLVSTLIFRVVLRCCCHYYVEDFLLSLEIYNCCMPPGSHDQWKSKSSSAAGTRHSIRAPVCTTSNKTL